MSRENYVSWIEEREKHKRIGNYRHIIADGDIAPTIVSSGTYYRKCDKKSYRMLTSETCKLSDKTMILAINPHNTFVE